MSGAFDFERLIELCQRTHEETRRFSANDDFAMPPRVSGDQSISDTLSRISSGLSPGTASSLCDDKNDAEVELTLPEDANIHASKHQLYLPAKEEFAKQLTMVRREVEEANGESDG